jgi:hemoglobin-like flavoprotein
MATDPSEDSPEDLPEDPEAADKAQAVADFLTRHELTAEDVEYLEERLGRLLKAADQLAPIFFKELFEQLPYVEAMFKSDVEKQQRMFNSLLWSAAACLHDPSEVHDRLAQIGERHARIGISSLQLRSGAQAFLNTLSQLLHKAEFDNHEALWAKVYQIIIDAMQPNFSIDDPSDDEETQTQP